MNKRIAALALSIPAVLGVAVLMDTFQEPSPAVATTPIPTPTASVSTADRVRCELALDEYKSLFAEVRSAAESAASAEVWQWNSVADEYMDLSFRHTDIDTRSCKSLVPSFNKLVGKTMTSTALSASGLNEASHLKDGTEELDGALEAMNQAHDLVTVVRSEARASGISF